jgi:drug/metabolite transporter (DMT)-like permease
MGSRRTEGLGALLLGAGLLGFAAIFVRWAEPASPLVIGFYRMLFALPGVLLLALSDPLRGRNLPKERESPDPGVQGYGSKAGPPGRNWAIAAGICFIADLWLWHLSLRHTSAANSTLLVGLSPLWVALMSIAVFGTRLRRRAWGGLGLALCGAMVLALAKGARWGTGYGEFLGAVASFAYAFFTLALARARTGLTARRALAWVSLTCLAGFGLLAWTLGDSFGPFPPSSWWALAGLGLVVQVLAWWLISWGLGHVDANLGSIGLLVQPVATVGLGWVFLGEHVKPVQGLGALFILSGIALSAFTPAYPSGEGPRNPRV